MIDADLSRASIAQAAFLLLVVWWAWIYATWMVNWFDPGSTKVRLILACVTLTSLLMSAAIPTAFGSEALALRRRLRLHAARSQRRRDGADRA